MRIIPILSAGLLALATLATPAQAQRHHHRGWGHGPVYRHHRHYRPIRRWHHHRERRLVCSRYWHHHRLVRRCRTIWY